MKTANFKNIICFGEVLWDMLPSGATPGGAPMNVAIHLNKQKIHPVLISRVGNDSEGENLKEFLNRAGLATDFIQTDISLPTSKVLVALDEQKNATYEIVEPVAWDNIQFSTNLEKAARAADLIIFGSLASRSNVTRNTLYQLFDSSPARRFLDVNLRPPFDDPDFIKELMQKSDFIKLNNDELEIIAGWFSQAGSEDDLIQWLAEFFNCELVCVTRGSNGAVLFSEKKLYHHPGFKVEAKDTVGAGDSFLASLVSGFTKNNSPQQALENACATGALVASKNGAVPDYSEEDIQRIKKSAFGA